MSQAVACVIPARWASSRFPGKMLHLLEGTPLVVHALRRAREAGGFSQVICLTDSREIYEVVRAEGFDAALTGEAANGTDRIARHLDNIEAELIVNLQGDEPAFPSEGLRLLRDGLRARPLWAHALAHEEAPLPSDFANRHRVKAMLDAEGRVLDFLREPPASHPAARCRVQMGAYGYSKDFLRRYAALPPSAREIAESHELLRSLEIAPIEAHLCAHPSQAVDVPQDLEKAAALLQSGLEARAETSQGEAQTANRVAERMTIINTVAPSVAQIEIRGQRVEA